MAEVRLSAVSYRYAGRDRPALNDVSLAIGPGITGIIGPNGAGKSTLFRLIAGVQLPSSGTVLIDGRTPHSYLAGHVIGLQPEAPAFQEELTAGEFLTGLAALTRTEPRFPFGTDELRDLRLGQLSLGQKRRVELAAALTGDAQLLLLDEPTNGLDPFAVIAFRDAVHAARTGNRTIIINSHHLDELQRIVDHVVLLNDGRIDLSSSTSEVMDQHGSFDDLFRNLATSTTFGRED